MSLSQPKIQNPCKKFIEFKGDDGVFQYYDKDNKKNIKLEYPITFIVLDELSTIKGYNEATGSGVYSNEIHSTKNQILNVRTFKGNTNISGLYNDIKDQVKSIGGKYCKSVYACLITDEGLELVNFQLTGAAFKSWIDKEVKPNEEIVTIVSTNEAKKGKVVYRVPVWKSGLMTDGLKGKAIEMDKLLQEFLKSKKLQDKEKEGVQDHPETESQEEPEGEEPF